jgi:hypothetical protein
LGPTFPDFSASFRTFHQQQHISTPAKLFLHLDLKKNQLYNRKEEGGLRHSRTSWDAAQSAHIASTTGICFGRLFPGTLAFEASSNLRTTTYLLPMLLPFLHFTRFIFTASFRLSTASPLRLQGIAYIRPSRPSTGPYLLLKVRGHR